MATLPELMASYIDRVRANLAAPDADIDDLLHEIATSDATVQASLPAVSDKHFARYLAVIAEDLSDSPLGVLAKMKPKRKEFEGALKLIAGTSATTKATKAKSIPKAAKHPLYLKVARAWVARASLDELTDPTGQGMGIVATLLVEGSASSRATLEPKFVAALGEQGEPLDVLRMLIKRHVPKSDLAARFSV